MKLILISFFVFTSALFSDNHDFRPGTYSRAYYNSIEDNPFNLPIGWIIKTRLVKKLSGDKWIDKITFSDQKGEIISIREFRYKLESIFNWPDPSEEGYWQPFPENDNNSFRQVYMYKGIDTRIYEKKDNWKKPTKWSKDPTHYLISFDEDFIYEGWMVGSWQELYIRDGSKIPFSSGNGITQ